MLLHPFSAMSIQDFYNCFAYSTLPFHNCLPLFQGHVRCLSTFPVLLLPFLPFHLYPHVRSHLFPLVLLSFLVALLCFVPVSSRTCVLVLSTNGHLEHMLQQWSRPWCDFLSLSTKFSHSLLPISFQWCLLLAVFCLSVCKCLS